MRTAPASDHSESHLPGGARRGRVLSLVIAALTVVPVAAGCQASASNSGPPAGSTAITVAAIRGVDNAPLYVAARNGAFARAGLDVRIVSYQSVSQELAALSKGRVDIAAGDYVDFFSLVASSGRPFLSIVADGYHAAPGVMEVLTYPGSGITTPQDLAHRTIATPLSQGTPPPPNSTKPYSLETLATQSVLQNDGVDTTTITWKPMPAGNLVTELSSHKVAAILVEEPYIFQAESKLGAIAVLDACSGATANLPLSGYFATKAFVHQRPLALHTFQRVLRRAQEAAVLPGPVRAELATEPGMNMQSASLLTIGAYPTTLNAASLQRVSDLMFSAEILNSNLKVASMIAR